MTAFFGDNVCFTAVADASVNLQLRNFKSFTEAAEEAGISRVYGGARWPSDNRDGLKAGRNLGKYVVEKFEQLARTNQIPDFSKKSGI